MTGLLVGLAGLAAFALAGAAYAAGRWFRSRRDRLCTCFYCSSRREAESRLFHGPGRLQARFGHLRYILARYPKGPRP
ncbi:hypothetical protein ACFCV3_42065 [Kribbella sp. NPDC056345]|uniref:hypothetical protein n=1 Tax=Kribbella sp. NPDC056345 TaxID=3345789 RepID=UPI0035E07CF5